MRGHSKNIVLFFIVSVSYLIAFSELTRQEVVPQERARQSTVLSLDQQAGSAENGSPHPPILKKKYKPKGLNVKIVVDLYTPINQIPHSETSDYFICQFNQTFHSQLSHVPYLPRDPPLA